MELLQYSWLLLHREGAREEETYVFYLTKDIYFLWPPNAPSPLS